jgi:hypothetical protein
MNDRSFIWTEAIGCGEILNPMLNSYLAHHAAPINVFVYEEDLVHVPESNIIIPHVISNQSNSLVPRHILEHDFKSGHTGTARLWARLIMKNSPGVFIHLDADTVFIGNVLDDLESKIEHYGIVGSRRPYKKTQSASGLRKARLWLRRDAVNTHCFAFRIEEIYRDESKLMRQILGHQRTVLQQIFSPVQDFFDEVAFQIMKSQGVWYLDAENQRRSGSHNRFGQFERKMISFAAVGSGCSFYHGKSVPLSQSYGDFAISSYALYSKYLLRREIRAKPLASDFLEDLLSRLDLSTWTLRS